MKSKNKAFTLVELIGVVAILAIMLLVAVPSLTKTLKNNEQKKYGSYIKNLELVTEQYIVKNILDKETIDDENPYYVSLKTLIDNGYVEDTIVNPTTEREISTDTRIKVTRNSDNSFKYDVQEYYHYISDYDSNNLIMHYDTAEYNKESILKNYGEYDGFGESINFHYYDIATLEGTGIAFNGGKGTINLKSAYDMLNTTISINLKPNDLETGQLQFSWFYDEDNKNTITITHSQFLFQGKLYDYVADLSSQENLELKNKNYTFTFVYSVDAGKPNNPAKLYINGQQVELKIDNSSGEYYPGFSYDEVSISGEDNWIMNNFLVYHGRLLDDLEVKDLYELDKERFGE